MSFDWKKTLATVAPVIATAFGGPMAGIATKMAAEALGLPSGSTEADIGIAVASGDTNLLLKLKEADHNFKSEMKRLDVDIQRIDSSDRGSARELGIAKGLIAQGALSIIFVGGFILVLAAMFGEKNSIPEGMMQPAMFLLGILATGMTQIMNFWFGSSAGSKTKTLQMGRS